jgi:hypothetical protein
MLSSSTNMWGADRGPEPNRISEPIKNGKADDDETPEKQIPTNLPDADDTTTEELNG